MFNPFKPHIVQLYTGEYAIRKYSFFMLRWEYLGVQEEYWWGLQKNALSHAAFPNLPQVATRLKEYNDLTHDRKNFSRRIL